MKVDRVAYGHSAAFTMFVLWALCAGVYYLAPALYFDVASSWVHGMNMRLLMTGSESLGRLLLGGISISASAWGVGYLFAWGLETFSQKKR